MDVQYRENLKQNIDDAAKKFQLDDLTYGSFIAQFGYKTKVSVSTVVVILICLHVCTCINTHVQLCASDMVHCTSALMECPDKPFSEAFLEALESLSKYTKVKIE